MEDSISGNGGENEIVFGEKLGGMVGLWAAKVENQLTRTGQTHSLSWYEDVKSCGPSKCI
jgi:hypothetical protein